MATVQGIGCVRTMDAVKMGVYSSYTPALAERSDLYFEAGNHEELLRLDGGEFETLYATAEHGRFSHHV